MRLDPTNIVGSSDMTGIYQSYKHGDSRCRVTQWQVQAESRAQNQMKMLRRVQNEKFTFEFDSEIALVDCTLGTLGPTVELDDEKGISEDLKSIKI